MACAILLTQPTVGIIHISFLTPTLPFALLNPIKLSWDVSFISFIFGTYLYSKRSPRAVFILWVCTWSPAFISSFARPILFPYLIISSPAPISFNATLCPAGISLFVTTLSFPIVIFSPAFNAFSATHTLSESLILI